MGKISLFSRIAKALREEEEESSEDIDRAVEAAVKAIDEMEVDVVDGGSVLGGGWGEAGDMVYIMDLAPLYAIIGGRVGRQADNLHETCERVFSQKVKAGRGRGSRKAAGFFMRFASAGKAEGFHLAASIVNAIGERVLGGRFQAMEVPALMVVADAATITNEDGSLNLEKASAVVKSGGLPLAMEEPAADAPMWLRQRWDSRLAGGDGTLVRGGGGAGSTASPGDPMWIGGADSGPDPGTPDWDPTETRPDTSLSEEWRELHHRGGMAQATAETPKRSSDEWSKRAYKDRRKAFLRFKGADKRVAMDRRGRGF